ncbi:peptide methionine sulfoxide reductase MsrA isoform X2 [Lepisosteus oculatus]|uniref:peptide methionine sulfoxide reductase MsrA isoform X2 n=1 Tax=Lepisosteus oculatus TaxID=7918 RepID=UPI0035F51EC1
MLLWFGVIPLLAAPLARCQLADMAAKTQLPSKEQALKGRPDKMVVSEKHAVSGHPTVEPFPDGMELVMFGMGCFWGAERRFWRTPGVFSTQVGYSGGITPNPTYEEVCTGLTGYTEVVRVVYDPQTVSFADLLKIFWESHNPTEELDEAISCVTVKMANSCRKECRDRRRKTEDVSLLLKSQARTPTPRSSSKLPAPCSAPHRGLLPSDLTNPPSLQGQHPSILRCGIFWKRRVK